MPPYAKSRSAIAAVSAALFFWLISPIEYTQPMAHGASEPPKSRSSLSVTHTATYCSGLEKAAAMAALAALRKRFLSESTTLVFRTRDGSTASAEAMRLVQLLRAGCTVEGSRSACTRDEAQARSARTRRISDDGLCRRGRCSLDGYAAAAGGGEVSRDPTVNKEAHASTHARFSHAPPSCDHHDHHVTSLSIL